MATPAFVAIGTPVEASATSVTVAHTLTAGDVLYALIGHLQDADPTSVMWNTSEAMTKVGTQIGNLGGLRNISVWRIVGGTSGTHNIVTTFAASAACAAVGFSYSTPNTTTPEDGAVTGDIADGVPNLTIVSPYGHVAVLCAVHSTAGTDITMTNGTKRSYQETANFGFVLCDRDGIGSTQINGTITSETNHVSVGFNLNGTVSPAIFSQSEA